jgi:hypothetical protein
MQIIRQVPFDAVIQSWLKAEWHDSAFDQYRSKVPQSLIDDEDFSNEHNNNIRHQLLRVTRYPILDPLPLDATWHVATYDRGDIDRTFIVPSNDWGPISGNRYHPYAIIPNLHMDDGHARKIKEIKASLASVDRRLVLVTSDIATVLTIIEGNHRGIAIFADAIERHAQNSLIEEVFVGVSPTMRQYPFHIEKYLRPYAPRP